jgi:hypothetical protein
MDTVIMLCNCLTPCIDWSELSFQWIIHSFHTFNLRYHGEEYDIWNTCNFFACDWQWN